MVLNYLTALKIGRKIILHNIVSNRSITSRNSIKDKESLNEICKKLRKVIKKKKMK